MPLTVEEEENRLIEAIEKVRRDKYQPIRYLLFTFLNGIAYGLGLALGMTIIVAILIYFTTIILSKMIDFPVVGQYVGDLMKIIDAYSKQGLKIR